MTAKCRSVLLATSGAAVLAGCDLFTAPICTTDARPALSVDVRDSSSNAPSAAGARLIARDGAFADTLLVPADGTYPGPYGLATERAGYYAVTVERDGYRPWSRSGILVTEDECHVRTVDLTALLRR